MAKSQDFYQNVWEVASLVPFGRVTTYGAIAKYLGSARSARMVGYAMNACHTNDSKVPAHRVVNRNGVLTGKFHFETIDTMEKRLKKEGINVVDDQIIHFEKYFWDPSVELE